MFKVTYLYHSGFMVELEKSILLFDYFRIPLPQLDEEKDIYVFASHKHGDHFDLKIFELAKSYKKVQYFLGSDVKLSDNYLMRNGIGIEIKEKIIHIGKNKEMQLENLKIKTLRSTDAGVAFLVNIEEKSIYHAGDLNWWHWSGETDAYNQNMKMAFCKEIDSIEGTHFDIAFVPLDPRQEEAYDYGMNYFLEKVQCDKVFPMHMWESYEWIETYKNSETGSPYASLIVTITEEMETWNI